MAQLKQKDAVVNAVRSVLGKLPTGQKAKEVLTADQLNAVRETVFNGIVSGEVEFRKSTDDHGSVRRYVNGMVDNHLRKAKELNGGVKYVPETRNEKQPKLPNGLDTSVLSQDLVDSLLS